MTARPALCTGQEVRDILAGRKTQMRRVVRPQPVDPMHGGDLPSGAVPDSLPRCPYGQPGDTLWVRETWAVSSRGRVAYRADTRTEDGATWASVLCSAATQRWRPSVHMPRWASRLTLEVVSVRMERLQDISEADAKAEGIESSDDDGVTYWGPLGKGHFDPRVAYRSLWESLHGPGSWAANPWVWVVGFRRAKP